MSDTSIQNGPSLLQASLGYKENDRLKLDNDQKVLSYIDDSGKEVTLGSPLPLDAFYKSQQGQELSAFKRSLNPDAADVLLNLRGNRVVSFTQGFCTYPTPSQPNVEEFAKLVNSSSSGALASLKGARFATTSTSPANDGDADFTINLQGRPGDPTAMIKNFIDARGKPQELNPALTLKDFLVKIEQSTSGPLSKLKGMQFSTIEVPPLLSPAEAKAALRAQVLAGLDTMAKPVYNAYLTPSTAAVLAVILMRVMDLKSNIAKMEDMAVLKIMSFINDLLIAQIGGTDSKGVDHGEGTIGQKAEAEKTNARAEIVAAALGLAGAFISMGMNVGGAVYAEIGGKTPTTIAEKGGKNPATITGIKTEAPNASPSNQSKTVDPDQIEIQIGEQNEIAKNNMSEDKQAANLKDAQQSEAVKTQDSLQPATSGAQPLAAADDALADKKSHGWQMRSPDPAAAKPNGWQMTPKGEELLDIKPNTGNQYSNVEQEWSDWGASKGESNEIKSGDNSKIAINKASNLNSVDEQAAATPSIFEAKSSGTPSALSPQLKADFKAMDAVLNARDQAPQSPSAEPKKFTVATSPQVAENVGGSAASTNNSAAKSSTNMDRAEALQNRKERLQDKKELFQKGVDAEGAIRNRGMAIQQGGQQLSAILQGTGKLYLESVHLSTIEQKAVADKMDAWINTQKELTSKQKDNLYNDRNKVDESFVAVLSLLKEIMNKDTEMNRALLGRI